MMEFIPILIIALAFGLILFLLIRSFLQWQANNRQPVLSVSARVVTKRTQVRSSGSGDSGITRTYYYCTFEDGTGTRREFRISGREYGQLVEADQGMLTYQGTRYHGFQRREDPWARS
jgi:Protein of unknown function (DUF2500)